MERFLSEMSRRKVLQTFLPYLGVVWIILQVVSVVTPMLQLSPMINTLFAVVLFAGIPVMLYLSWFFDFTPTGLKRTRDVDTGDSPSFGIVHWVIFSLITSLSAYGSAHYYLRVKEDFQKQQEGLLNEIKANSVVVVPFTDSSPEQDQNYLAAGLAEEIARLLGANSPLQVAASSSARSLSEQGMDPVSIARRLGVDAVLAGSLRRQGSKLRVYAELIEVATNKVAWSSTYNRNFDDVFSIESEIARSTANGLIDDYIATGSLANPLSTKSADAYVLYLRGRQAYNLQTTDSIKEARQLFEQAVALDPEYSQAYVSLADTIALSADGSRNFGILKPDIAKMLAVGHLDKALIRNPEMAEAHAVQGRVYDLGGEPEAALRAFNTAIELNPSLAKAHMWKYLLLRDLGREVEAFETLKVAKQLDPESITLRYNYGIEMDRRGKFSESMQAFTELMEEYPTLPMGYVGMAGTYFSLGDLSKSVEYWQRAHAISPDNDDYLQAYVAILLTLGLNDTVRGLSDNPDYLPILLFNEGRHVELAEEMQILLASYPEDPWIAFEVSWHFMLLEKWEEAFALLEKTDALMADASKTAMPSCSPGIEIFWAYLRQERPEKADGIFRSCKEGIASLEAAGIMRHEQAYLRVRMAALEGDASAANALLDLMKAGFMESWIPHDPLLTTLHGSTAYAEAMQLLEDNLSRERAETQLLFASAPAN